MGYLFANLFERGIIGRSDHLVERLLQPTNILGPEPGLIVSHLRASNRRYMGLTWKKLLMVRDCPQGCYQ